MSYSQILKKEYLNDPNEYIKEVYEVNAASKLVVCPANGRVMKIDNVPVAGQSLVFKQQNAGTLVDPDALTFANPQTKAISRRITSNVTIDPVGGTQVPFNLLEYSTDSGFGTNQNFIDLPDSATLYNCSSYLGFLIQPTASKFQLEIEVVSFDGVVATPIGVSSVYVDSPTLATQYYVSTTGMTLTANTNTTIDIKVVGVLISGPSYPAIIANAGNFQVSSGKL
jgi:hypothetical protein